MAETWAEQELDGYLKRYAEGSDECERRQRICMLCGDKFDIDECVALPVYRRSKLKFEEKKPLYLCICKGCYGDAEKIESEDDYE